jgi:predicted enzyme related to lactoylglutathione lyase
MTSTDPAALRLGNVTLDCADPQRVAAFWSAALARPIDDGASEFFVSIGHGDESTVGWFFIQVPEGKEVKNRVHVDLHADDRDAAVARLLALGAQRHSDHDEFGVRWTTMLDVEGNEFCVA